MLSRWRCSLFDAMDGILCSDLAMTDLIIIGSRI
jgi:hypothetical protein